MPDLRRVSLPVMQCDEGCPDCCGVVPCKENEYRDVVEYAKANGIEPISQGASCPFFQCGRCTVYPVRPWVCRFYGHSPRMECPRGYNVNVKPEVERRFDRQYGKPTRILHEVLVPEGMPKAEAEAFLLNIIRGDLYGEEGKGEQA